MAIIKLAPERNSEQDDQFTNNIDWLLYCVPAGGSEVVSGKEGGKSFAQYIEDKGWGCLGTRAKDDQVFPYSVKLINGTKDVLLQINPYEEKESLWYVLSAQPGAQMFFGLNQELSEDQFKEAIENATLPEYMQVINPEAGDVFEVEAGTVFAIGEGIVILDIQKSGNEPEFSDEDIFSTLKLKPVSHDRHESNWLANGDARYECLGNNNIFDADLYELNGAIDVDADEKTCKVLVFIEGSAVIDSDGETLHAEKNSTFFVEAGTYPFKIVGNCKFVEIELV